MINNFSNNWISENKILIKDFIFNMEGIDVGESFTIINRDTGYDQYLVASYIGPMSKKSRFTIFICKSDNSYELNKIKHTYTDLYSYVTNKKRQKIIDDIL